MKENLFRGQRKDSEQFYYGGYYFWNGNHFIVETGKNGNLYDIEVIPETVGQFTGLTDKNGVKIFESDLFQVAGNKVYEVVYCDFDNSYDGDGIYCCFALFDRKRNTKIAFDDYAMKNGEVIGSIHDNQEVTP